MNVEEALRREKEFKGYKEMVEQLLDVYPAAEALISIESDIPVENREQAASVAATRIVEEIHDEQ